MLSKLRNIIIIFLIGSCVGSRVTYKFMKPDPVEIIVVDSIPFPVVKIETLEVSVPFPQPETIKICSMVVEVDTFWYENPWGIMTVFKKDKVLEFTAFRFLGGEEYEVDTLVTRTYNYTLKDDWGFTIISTNDELTPFLLRYIPKPRKPFSWGNLFKKRLECGFDLLDLSDLDNLVYPKKWGDLKDMWWLRGDISIWRVGGYTFISPQKKSLGIFFKLK